MTVPNTDMTRALIEAVNVQRRYRTGGTDVHALRGVSLRINEGEFVAIVGASGSGKSTLLHLLGAVDAPDSGKVLFDGNDISRLTDAEATRLRLNRVGLVFQRFYLMPTLSALENVALPMAEAGVSSTERRTRARHLLSFVGLGERTSHRPTQLSGGEQQRVAVARALANKPALLLADEPTGELDAATGKALIELLQSLNADGLTCVLVTHDPALAQSARRVVTMRDGQIVSDTAVSEPSAAPSVSTLPEPETLVPPSPSAATSPAPTAATPPAPSAAATPATPRRPSLTPADADAAFGASE